MFVLAQLLQTGSYIYYIGKAGLQVSAVSVGFLKQEKGLGLTSGGSNSKKVGKFVVE